MAAAASGQTKQMAPADSTSWAGGVSCSDMCSVCLASVCAQDSSKREIEPQILLCLVRVICPNEVIAPCHAAGTQQHHILALQPATCAHPWDQRVCETCSLPAHGTPHVCAPTCMPQGQHHNRGSGAIELKRLFPDVLPVHSQHLIHVSKVRRTGAHPGDHRVQGVASPTCSTPSHYKCHDFKAQLHTHRDH